MTEKTDPQKLICESVDTYILFFQEIKRKGSVFQLKNNQADTALF